MQEQKTKNRCVIISAAPIHNYKRIKRVVEPLTDYFIFCDAGLNHLESLGVKPDMVVGDFDSYPGFNPADFKGVTIYHLNPEKDDTDTEYAIKKGIELGFKVFLLLGCVGARIDHTLANIHLLEYLSDNNCDAVIVDDYSSTRYMKPAKEYKVQNDCKYFSIIPLSKNIQGLTITNAKYNAAGITANRYTTLTMSNEPLCQDCLQAQPTIRFTKGEALLIEVQE